LLRRKRRRVRCNKHGFDLMKKLIEIFQQNKVMGIVAGALILFLVLLLALLLRPPQFPEETGTPEDSQQALEKRLAFFQQFTQYLEENHGGLLNSEQLNPREGEEELQAPGIFTFRQQFRFLNQSLVAELSKGFAGRHQMQSNIRIGCTSYQQEASCHELDFRYDNNVWIRILLESVRPKFPEKGKKSEYMDRLDPADKEQPTEAVKGGARLAIVIDDLGYRMEVFNDLITLDYDITYAVLPQQAHSRETAEIAAQAGRQVMLHMPMQPKDWPRFDPGLGALLIDDSADEIRSKIALNLETVPHVAGINNHMGSAFTQHAPGLDVLMHSLSENGLFFLDSKTAPGMTAREAAAKYNVPYLSRDIFLDNDRDEALIGRQLDKAAALARSRGWAIAIGHPYGVTYTVLARQLPRLEAQGITIIKVVDLLN